MQRYYAGIGSRETPPHVCEAMTCLARKLSGLGFILRSGGAIGADQAFERGSSKSEIFLPWKEFEGNQSEFTEPSHKAIKLSKELFHHFPGASNGTRALISRNMHQILGPDVFISPPSEFVICLTPDAKITGGTAYAIKAAKEYDIPIFNLASDLDVIKLFTFLEDLA